jgi:hypothetical protein
MMVMKTGNMTRKMSSRVAASGQSGGHDLGGIHVDALEVGRRRWLVSGRNNGSIMR